MKTVRRVVTILFLMLLLQTVANACGESVTGPSLPKCDDLINQNNIELMDTLILGNDINPNDTTKLNVVLGWSYCRP
jgi:hypothetical protein